MLAKAARQRLAGIANRRTFVDRAASQRNRKHEIVAAEFDSDFYLSTNPDIRGAAAADPVAHYLDVGWRAHRDPAPWFSTKAYLDRHPDVSEAGLNPFHHYIAHGRLEGRAVDASRFAPTALDPKAVQPEAALATDREPDVSADTRSRIGVVSMVKNEADIIELFSSHILQLFDVVVFIDHGSLDGTFEYLKDLENSRRDVTVYKLEEAGYIQSTVTNYIVRTAKELQGVDWIFFLDADEFLPFESREAFSTALSRLRGSTLIQMHWRNVIPVDYWDYRVDMDRSFLVPADDSPFVKVAFQPKLLRERDFWIEQGNHSITEVEGGQEISGTVAFPLWHLPIRSTTQLSLKLSQGVASYLRLGSARRDDVGNHWFEALAAMRGHETDGPFLNRLAATYGQFGGDFSPLSHDELKRLGYGEADLRIARADIEIKVKPPESPATLVVRVNGDMARKPLTEIDERPVRRLETLTGRVIRRAPEDTGFQFGVLPRLESSDQPLHEPNSGIAFLRDFLRPGYWSIDDLVPTKWGGHIPFMFAYVAAFRPRRYVELGTQWGGSFLSCCQAIARSRSDTRAIAIDTWQGDQHTGPFDADHAFNNFTWILRKYAGFASYLRQPFDDALRRFEDRSIDLLHIDGMHTYEAVRHDFESWLPKMSECGTIFMHDITVHERDFGVWQFWDEIKKQYPTMSFRHCHGLGVVYVGSMESFGSKRLIDMFSEDEDLSSLLQHHFEKLGEINTEQFQLKFQLMQTAEQVKALGMLNEEVSNLRQQISESEAVAAA